MPSVFSPQSASGFFPTETAVSFCYSNGLIIRPYVAKSIGVEAGVFGDEIHDTLFSLMGGSVVMRFEDI
jgi:hypothetical protein